MKRIRLGLGCCVAVALGSAAFIIGRDLTWEWRAVCLIFLTVSFISGAAILVQEQSRQRQRMLRSYQWSAIELMNHQRHDWMNDLQLLYGYVRLKKYDKLPECVETIKARMAEESRIAKLGIPELVMFLMQQRTSGGTMPLDVIIPEPVELDRLNLEVDTSRLADVIMETVQTFRFAPKAQMDTFSPLQLAFVREPNRLVIRYRYEGKLLRPGEVAAQLSRIASERGVRLEQLSAKQNNEHDAFHIVVPCSA